MAQAEMDTITARLRRDHPDVYPPNGGLTFASCRSSRRSSATSGARWSCSSARSASCCSSRARMSRTCCWRAPSRVRRRWRCVPRSGRAARRLVRQLLTESVVLAARAVSSGSCWPKRCSRAFARSARQAFRVSAKLRSTGACSPSPDGLDPVGRPVRTGAGVAARARPLHAHLKDGARGSEGCGRAVGTRSATLRRLLVVAELAHGRSCCWLAAGLLVRSFVRLQDVPPGFNPAGVLTFELTMSGRRYNDGKAVLGAYRSLWPALDGSRASSRRAACRRFRSARCSRGGRSPSRDARRRLARSSSTPTCAWWAADYFQAMEIPLHGRAFFEERDTRDQPRVVDRGRAHGAQLWPRRGPRSASECGSAAKDRTRRG